MKLAVKTKLAGKTNDPRMNNSEILRKHSQTWTETESGPDRDQQPSQVRQDPEMEADLTSSWTVRADD